MIAIKSKGILEKFPSLSGKTVAVTGATGGIGRPLCRYLAKLGASLVLLGRNTAACREFADCLQKEFPGTDVTTLPLDLEDPDSVKRACEALKALPVDVLIHNAGAYAIERRICKTGFDNVFQINFVSPYYITKELLPLLRARKGRVVAVGSIAHRYSKTDPSDIDFSTRKSAAKVYGNAKRTLMFSAYSLFEWEEDATLAVAHPGISFTNITAHYPKVIFALIKHPMKWIFMKPEKACLSVLQGVFTPCERMEWIGPRLFDVWGKPKKRKLDSCTEEEYRHIAAVAEECYERMKKQQANGL